MPFIGWDDSLSVGVAEIDQEHKEEIELLNRLHDAEGEDIPKTFQELAEHTVKHFQTEERYFDKFNYEDSTAHKATHKQFLKQAEQVGKDIEAGKEISEDTLNLIKTWLVNHIKSMDKKYTKCFNENGLT
ncbi:bacteriohemerythrin [Nanoarchaeota archaeon]